MTGAFGMSEVVERRVVVELAQLRGDRIDDFTAAVTDIDAPQAADAVQHAVAIRVIDKGSVSLCDDGACSLCLQSVEIGEGMNEMGIECQDLVGQVLAFKALHD